MEIPSLKMNSAILYVFSNNGQFETKRKRRREEVLLYLRRKQRKTEVRNDGVKNRSLLNFFLRKNDERRSKEENIDNIKQSIDPFSPILLGNICLRVII